MVAFNIPTCSLCKDHKKLLTLLFAMEVEFLLLKNKYWRCIQYILNMLKIRVLSFNQHLMLLFDKQLLAVYSN